LSDADAAYRAIVNGKPPACVADGLAKIHVERLRRARVLQRSLAHDGVSERLASRLAEVVGRGGETRIVESFRSEIAGEDGFAIARALKLSGYPGDAGDVLARAIVARPDAELPDDLRGLSDSGLRLAAAKALIDAGLDEASREQVKLALQGDPTLKLPDELTSPERRESFWRKQLGIWGPRIRTSAEILIALLAAVVGGLLLSRAVRRFRPRLVIDAFGGGVEKENGTATTVAVRENYGRLVAQHGGSRLGFVDSSAEASFGLPKEVVASYPQAGIIAALFGLIDRLLPSRTRQVSGYLRPRDPRRGAGVTLTLSYRYGRAFDEITLWESDYGALAPQGEKDPAQPAYDRLGVPAAAWLVFGKELGGPCRPRMELARTQPDSLE
jgi:hypothetical protein